MNRRRELLPPLPLPLGGENGGVPLPQGGARGGWVHGPHARPSVEVAASHEPRRGRTPPGRPGPSRAEAMSAPRGRDLASGRDGLGLLAAHVGAKLMGTMPDEHGVAAPHEPSSYLSS